MSPSKSVGGFDLLLGKLYDDGWFNHEPPRHDVLTCRKCGDAVTIHKLHKFVVAFGHITEKFTEVVTCPACLNEYEHPSYYQDKKRKATKRNLAAIFAKLPKSVQAALLTSGGAK